MNSRTPKLEILVNVAIIAVAVAICAVVYKQYFADDPQRRSQGPAVGSKVEVPGLDLASEGATLLLVLQEGCRFCTESAPFYQRLASEAAARGNRTRLVAIFPQDLESGRRYLTELGVPVERVALAPFRDLDISGTPTLILLNRATVSQTWVGKLPPSDETTVLNKL